MAGGRVSVFLLAALALMTAGSPLAAAQGSIALPNIIDPKIKLPTILPPKEGPVTVSLPDLGLPGISLLNTVNLPPNRRGSASSCRTCRNWHGSGQA
jgi:hypothetical protein